MTRPFVPVLKTSSEDRRILLILILVLLVPLLLYFGLRAERKVPPPKQSSSAIVLWDWADDFISPPPEIASTKELYQLFLEARQAIAEENAEAMQEKLSSELLWHSQNPLRYLGDEAGIVANTRRKISSREFFQEFLSFSPPAEQTIPIDTLYRGQEGRMASQTLLINDTEGNLEEKVLITPWRYSLRLRVRTKDELLREGWIVFVFDQGAWRYHAENWLGK